nr:MAG TPA: hypothetical protein [Caudoviricetes sp.]
MTSLNYNGSVSKLLGISSFLLLYHETLIKCEISM